MLNIFSQTNIPLIYQRLQKTKISGVADSLLTGTCTVFENHTTNKGRIINLNVIVIPGLHSDSLLPPIFDIDAVPAMLILKMYSSMQIRPNYPIGNIMILF